MGLCGSAPKSPRERPESHSSKKPDKPKKNRSSVQRPVAAAAPKPASPVVGGGETAGSPSGTGSPVLLSPRNKGEVCGLSLEQRQQLADETHFSVSEIEVLCKHFSELSASQQDDGVIDKGEWRCAFYQNDTDNLEISRNVESDLAFRKASSVYRPMSLRQGSHRSFTSPTKPKPTVSAAVVEDSFVNLPHMFLDRMFALFDGDGNMEIDLGEFIRGLSVFSKRGTTQEKIAFAFRLYDIDGDGFISQSELRAVLVGSLREANAQNSSSSVAVSQEVLDKMIEETFSEADTNGDGRIDESEFTNMVQAHPDIISNINFRASILAKGSESIS